MFLYAATVLALSVLLLVYDDSLRNVLVVLVLLLLPFVIAKSLLVISFLGKAMHITDHDLVNFFTLQWVEPIRVMLGQFGVAVAIRMGHWSTAASAWITMVCLAVWVSLSGCFQTTHLRVGNWLVATSAWIAQCCVTLWASIRGCFQTARLRVNQSCCDRPNADN